MLHPFAICQSWNWGESFRSQRLSFPAAQSGVYKSLGPYSRSSNTLRFLHLSRRWGSSKKRTSLSFLMTGAKATSTMHLVSKRSSQENCRTARRSTSCPTVWAGSSHEFISAAHRIERASGAPYIWERLFSVLVQRSKRFGTDGVPWTLWFPDTRKRSIASSYPFRVFSNYCLGTKIVAT